MKPEIVESGSDTVYSYLRRRWVIQANLLIAIW